MCRTYNTIGSLTTLKSRLENNNINDFKSLKDVINFQNSYSISRQHLISHHEKLIEEEKNMLNSSLQQLEKAIEIQRQQTEQKLTDEINRLEQQLNIATNNIKDSVLLKLYKTLKNWNFKRQIKDKNHHFENNIKKSICKLNLDYEIKKKRLLFITSQENDAIQQSAQNALSELERKKSTIDALNPFIYGALGEQKVAKTLENLSDEYFLINDFAVSFTPAIYNWKENDYIKSIQIDHILVGPSGIFLIETKNWNEKSLESVSLHSPVKQVKRTSFALFKLLNNEISNYQLRLDQHHWGEKKIVIKNIIALINTKPKEEFQFVKIVTLKELLGYVTYFKPIFTSNETQGIVDFLIGLNEQKTVVTKFDIKTSSQHRIGSTPKQLRFKGRRNFFL